jgi:hypothetical protein
LIVYPQNNRILKLYTFNSSIGACFFPTLLITTITHIGMESAD